MEKVVRTVGELGRPARAEGRGGGKTDAIDAALGAAKALGLDVAALPTTAPGRGS